MTHSTIRQYLYIPALIAVGAFAFALGKEPFQIELLLSALLGGFLYYAAPFLLWTLVVSIAPFSSPVSHSGFIAASVALVVLAALSFLPGDPSDLPIHWLLYWPLAIVLQGVSITGTALYVRWRSKVAA